MFGSQAQSYTSTITLPDLDIYLVNVYMIGVANPLNKCILDATIMLMIAGTTPTCHVRKKLIMRQEERWQNAMRLTYSHWNTI